MRIFLDANILFSAANPKWRTSVLVQWLIENATCVTSSYAVEEARRNLAASFPEHRPSLEKLLRQIEIHATAICKLDSSIDLKEKDRPILAAAISAYATHLLTGDQKDFKVLLGATILGVRVVTQRMLAEELQKLGLI